MIRIISILFICGIGINSSSQSTAGITHKADTSFTLHSAYISTLKTFPDIRLVTEIHPSSILEKRNIVYCTVGDRQLKLDAFYPKTRTVSKQKAILIIHGGGWRSGNRSIHYPLAERLAALGYVCFSPEYRLSTEALYPAAVNDIKSSLKWVRAHATEYNIDTSAIVAMGHSAGGELAAFLGATNGMPVFETKDCNPSHSSSVNAVVDIDGILAFIHPESGEGDDSKRVSAATNWFGYSKTDGPQLWKQASALTHVGPQSPPILFLNSSVDRMHAGREDYIKILDHYNIYSEVKTFEGAPHSFCLFEPWFDPMVKDIDNFLKKVFDKKSANDSQTIIVAKDGSGQFTSIQPALDAVPLNNSKSIVIFIRNGTYKEKLHLDSTKNFVTLIGEDKFNTILSYDDHTGKVSPMGDTINTRTSWSFLIRADNFKATDLTFQNDAGFSAGQAVALESDGDKAIFKNCRFIGNQDVLFTNSEKSRQYYEDCYIEGTTDFIFGSATVWFQQCHIHSKKNSHVTAASTPNEKEYGYIFNNCVLTGDTSLHAVSLGRPWRPYASVVYLHCFIGEHIKAEGWSNWNNTENYKTARYAEYQNFGASADPSKRVAWAKQLTSDEARRYTKQNVFKDWNP